MWGRCTTVVRDEVCRRYTGNTASDVFILGLRRIDIVCPSLFSSVYLEGVAFLLSSAAN